MDLNYFVCTLEEAAQSPSGRPFHNVNHLLDEQAKQRPDFPAVGFYRVREASREAELEYEILTFKQVRQGVLKTAKLLLDLLDGSTGQLVGLLASSSPEFLFVWLACVRIGLPVLLIAPQLSASGIAGLCKEAGAAQLLVDEGHEELCRQAVGQGGSDGDALKCLRIPINGYNVFQLAKSDLTPHEHQLESASAEVAYLHHTSGTSSGTPKSIPQTQHGAVGVLPSLRGENDATFTTTPLYHGGPADIFRAWTSSAMIWLFPAKDLPITAANVLRCLQSSKEASDAGLSPQVKYLGCVPYVLQAIAEDENGAGLRWLQSMRLVGVGGAALPPAIGDELTEKGVNLLSRFGSAECGFLLSSNRDYAKDKAWQYLRLPQQSSQLRLEPREDGLSELVVLAEWPHMAKRNREDSSYATADLFEPHPHIENAWRYHSRADSQLTLITGKKFDPAPIEDVLSTVSPIQAAYVFGNGRPYPGALLFRSSQAADATDQEILQHVAPTVDDMNDKGPAHSRVPRSTLIPMAHTHNPLEKSSKGTIIRKSAEERYAAEIEAAYAEVDDGASTDYSDDDLPAPITAIIRDVLGKNAELDESRNLFSLGIDSVAGIQIRSRLRRLLPESAPRLPVTVVEDCGTIANLAKLVKRLRHGDQAKDADEPADELEYMRSLVDEYSKFTEPAVTEASSTTGVNHDRSAGEVVVLTGCTGFLGAQVLAQLREASHVSKIYCLVRGATLHAARERVDKALQQRKLPGLQPGNSSDKVIVLQSLLSHPKLGLSQAQYRTLTTSTTTILHLAWSVNFNLQLRSFVPDSIASIPNFIHFSLSCSTPPKFIFCSSVASVQSYTATPTIPETLIENPAAASATGYSRSKWVAESILSRAAHEHSRLRGRITILRVGQLSIDRQGHAWNPKEAWPLMLSTLKLTGCLPRLKNQALDWLPVDVAAEAVIQAASLRSERDGGEGQVRVYHILNPNSQPTWEDLLVWLGTRVAFEVVEPGEWIARMEGLAERSSEDQKGVPALQLLDFWRRAYGGGREGKGGEEENVRAVFGMERTRREVDVLRGVEPLSEEYFAKLWEWMEGSMG